MQSDEGMFDFADNLRDGRFDFLLPCLSCRDGVATQPFRLVVFDSQDYRDKTDCPKEKRTSEPEPGEVGGLKVAESHG
jgi:hypothetical protein